MAAIYNMAKAIYEGNETLTEGKIKIHSIYNVPENSFATYYGAYRCMLDGKCHTRGINVELRDYMLNRILIEYGLQRYKTAVKAYLLFIDYDTKHKNINKIKERELYKKHTQIIATLEVLDGQLAANKYSSTEQVINMKRNPKFSINGTGSYTKKIASFEVLKRHVQSMHLKYHEIYDELNNNNLGKWIKPQNEVPRENPNDKQWNKRWNFEEPLMSSDRIEFLVSLEIGSCCPIDFNNIRNMSEKWGYKIEEIK